MFIHNEFDIWLKSPSAWKLSCYSFKKFAPCMPILADLSPEEVRYGLYEARRNNLFNQAVSYALYFYWKQLVIK
jgi:hypothetical protein